MRWLFFIVIFFAAVMFGFEMIQDPGYALFVYHGWMVQMPLWLVLLLLLLLLFFVYFSTRLLCGFIFLKRSLRFWWLERRFRKRNHVKQK